jgi:hypothetical protein
MFGFESFICGAPQLEHVIAPLGVGLPHALQKGKVVS